MTIKALILRANNALFPACEEFNRLLDRGLVIGPFDNPEIGFFNRATEG